MRDWLKEKRREHGYTMAQMADKLDITESYYSMIEAGNRQKKLDMILAGKISSILAIPVERIAELETENQAAQ